MNTFVACTDVVHGCIQHDYKLNTKTLELVYKCWEKAEKRMSKSAAAKDIFTPDQIEL